MTVLLREPQPSVFIFIGHSYDKQYNIYRRKIMKHFLQITFIFCILFTACSPINFNGNISSTEDNFQMDYAVFNQSQSSSLTLSEGDSLSVLISHAKGSVDVKVYLPGKEPIYEGNNLTNMNCTLNIHESGTYQIDITGHNASGTVQFTKKSKS